MMKTKNIIIISVLTAIIVPFIAFNAHIIGSNGYEDDETSNTLSLQIYCNGNKKVESAWRNICFDFEDETEIIVKPHIGKTINTDMKNDWNNDNPPDFVWVSGNGIGDTSLIKNGKFYNLSEWYETAKVYGETTPIKQAINNKYIFQYNDGKMYEMPVLGLTHGLYYDINYMEKEGYDIPSNYDEALALASQSYNNSQAMITYPGKYASYLLWSFIMPAVAAYNDTAFFDKICSAEDPSIYDDPRFVDVLTRFYNLVHFDSSDDSKSSMLIGSETFDHTGAQRNWLNNDALAIGNGMWLESEIIDSLLEKEDFGMYFTNSPLITSEQKETALLIPSNCAIAQYGKHKDNALTFLSYLYKEDVQQQLAEAYSYFSVLKDPEDEEYTLTDVTRQTYDAVNNAELIVYKNHEWGTVGDIFNDVINCLVDGTNTVSQGIKRIKNEAEKQ